MQRLHTHIDVTSSARSLVFVFSLREGLTDIFVFLRLCVRTFVVSFRESYGRRYMSVDDLPCLQLQSLRVVDGQ